MGTSTRQIVGKPGNRGEARQIVGETRQIVGETRQIVGETRQIVGEARQIVGETRRRNQSWDGPNGARGVSFTALASGRVPLPFAAILVTVEAGRFRRVRHDMAFASQQAKDEIRDRVPLEELVREYNVQLKPSGRSLKGLCPFHQEKTPSFHVHPERQTFYCFGCQEKGDLFDFVQKIDNVEFVEALELLARRAGVVLERGHNPEAGRRAVAQRDALEIARDFYHGVLLRDPAAAAAREYLARRGIEFPMWERFRLGFAPTDGQSFLREAQRRRIPAEILAEVGLARRRDDGRGSPYDSFRGRLLFPIGDASGRPIGFGARTLGDEVPKYINTPKTALFDKSNVLYGLAESRRGIGKAGVLVVVEGYTDVIVAHQAGLDFVVASLGTAFTRDNARRLGRLASRAILVFDGDAAGQKATERSLDLLVSENLDVRVYAVSGGKDPAEVILEGGGEAFRAALEKESVGLFEYKWRRTMGTVGETEAGGQSQAHARGRALDEFLELLSKVPNVVTSKLYVREFAERIGVPEEDFERRLRQLKPKRNSAREYGGGPRPGEAVGGQRAAGGGRAVGTGASAAQPVGGAAESDPESPRARMSEDAAVETLVVECLLALPHRAQEMLSQVPAGFFQSPAPRSILAEIPECFVGGELSTKALLRAVEDPVARDMLIERLSRVETEDGSPSCDYEEVWKSTLRDIWRRQRGRRVEELKTLLGRTAKDSAEHASLQRELFAIMKELKRVRKTKHGESSDQGGGR